MSIATHRLVYGRILSMDAVADDMSQRNAFWDALDAADPVDGVTGVALTDGPGRFMVVGVEIHSVVGGPNALSVDDLATIRPSAEQVAETARILSTLSSDITNCPWFRPLGVYLVQG